MIQNASFIRKVVYGAIIAVLLIPLSLISRPAVREADGQLSSGGLLAQMRADEQLAQSSLGEIDPASETMKLATLGMRGVAANLLWERANRYKREHDWDNLAATLNQITKLQPNFISVWQFQGWNLAYNVSVEFDDYRSRYHWVKRGINFLRDGIRYNTEEPVMDWEIGWTFGHKIGKADEYIQYRRLFREDRDFHLELSDGPVQAANIDIDETLGPDNRPDNWLAGREYFLKAEALVARDIPIRGRLLDETGRIRRGKNPLIFHSHAPKWLISFAEAMERDGYLDEKAQVAWMRAGRAWNEFGDMDIPTSYSIGSIRLNDGEKFAARAIELSEELDALLPGVRATIKSEKLATLTDEEREALDTPALDRSLEQIDLASRAERKIAVNSSEVAERAPADKQREVNRIARQGKEAEGTAEAIENYRDQVAYLYWKLRCEIEQTDTAITARRHLYDAEQAFEVADLDSMRTHYEAAWDLWSEIFEEHPEMMETTTADDLMEGIERYRWVLDQLDEPFPPPDFKLRRLLEVNDPEFNPNLGDLDAADEL